MAGRVPQIKEDSRSKGYIYKRAECACSASALPDTLLRTKTFSGCPKGARRGADTAGLDNCLISPRSWPTFCLGAWRGVSLNLFISGVAARRDRE